MESSNDFRLPLLSFLFTGRVIAVWLTAAGLCLVMLASPAGSPQQFAIIVVLVVATPFYVGFAFDIIEQTALGHAVAPAFSFSPLAIGPRLLRLLVYLSLVVLFIRVTPEPLRWLALSSVLGVTPAITSFIVFHEPMLSSLNPLRLWQFVSNMGLTYITLRLVTTSVLFVGLYVASGEIDFLASDVGLVLASLGFVLLVILMCRIVGMLLHQRRQELGLKTHFSTEQLASQKLEQRRGELARELEAINLVCRSEGFKVAWPQLENLARRRGYMDDRFCMELLREFKDRRLLYRFASGYIARRLPGEVSHAWTVLLEMFEESGGRFRLHSGTLLLSMVSLAERREERLALLTMLEAFDESFPDHPRKREALLEGARLALLADEDPRAVVLLEQVDGLSGDIDESLYRWCQRQLG